MVFGNQDLEIPINAINYLLRHIDSLTEIDSTILLKDPLLKYDTKKIKVKKCRSSSTICVFLYITLNWNSDCIEYIIVQITFWQ